MSYDITPIFVFDGQHLDEKADTKEERMKQSNKLRDDIAEIKERVRCKDILDVMPHDVTELRKKMRNDMEIPYNRFIDLCIMSGTDFNKNIPGLGCITAYKLLQTYGRIDNLPSKYDTSILKHRGSRRIFRRSTSEESTEGPINELEGVPEDFYTDLLGNEIDFGEVRIDISKNWLHACGRDLLDFTV